MRSFHTHGLLCALLLLGASTAGGQTLPSSSSVLPLPETLAAPSNGYGSTGVSPWSGYRPKFTTLQEPVYSGEPVPSGVSDTSTLGAFDPNSPATTTTTTPADQMGSACGVGCGNCCGCVPCCNGRWFGSVGGLLMTRNHPNPFWTTYQTNNNPNQLMNTKDGMTNWAGGGQVTFGRWWCCPSCDCQPGNGWGLQFTYWQLGDLNAFSSLNSLQLFGVDGGLSTPINLGNVNITNSLGTNPASDFFDSSNEHRIYRTNRFLNVELNVLHQKLYSVPQQCNITCLAGFRYMRFQDVLTFGAVSFGHSFGDDGGADEAYLTANVTNNMFGGQIGFLTNYAFTPQCGVFFLPKFGVFGNNITAINQLYTGDGFTQFNIHGHKTALALMGELDTGAYWWLTSRCQLFGGWRVLGISQVALADNQFLPYLADSAGFAQPKANGDLILTGFFGGIAFTF